jgi:tetratricopeptide (TPR) repeat protein
MNLGSAAFPVLSLLLLFQSPQDSLRQHYEAAEARRQAGDLAGAESEYTIVLAEAYERLGKIYGKQKEYKDSVSALERAAAYEPSSEDILVALAIAYFQNQQYQKAFDPLNKALAANPRSLGAHHMLGKTYFMLGDFAKSTSELEAALKMQANDYDVSYTLGLSYLEQHQFGPAKKIYDGMVERLGDKPQLHILFGRAYRETDFLPEAIEEFKKAVALDPHFPRAHYYLGLTYLLKYGVAKLDEAAEQFKIELTASPDEFYANYYLGVVSIIQRQWDLAAGFLTKASRAQPDNPDPYFYLGQAYQALEKYSQAVEALKKTIALNPDLGHNDYQVTTAHFRLGQALIKAGQTEAGQKELQTSADLKSKSVLKDKEKTNVYLAGADLRESAGNLAGRASTEGILAESEAPDEKVKAELKDGAAYYAKVVASAHNSIGLLRAQRKDFHTAAEHFGMASKWNPQLEGVDLNWGLACFKAELYKEAVPPLERVLKDHPDNLQAKQLVGLSFFMQEDYLKASNLLTYVVASKPRDVGVYYALAISLIKQGKQEAGDRVIRDMMAMAGDTPELHIILAQAYDRETGDTAKALEELKTALSLNSRTLLAHYYSGLIYIKIGKFNEAAREFESELALNPNDLQAKYHLGFVFLAQQEIERGIKFMREVIEVKPDFADAHYELGKALLQKGDLKGSVENLELATKLEPDKPYVHFQLGRAYLALGRNAEGESQLAISKKLKDQARGATKP